MDPIALDHAEVRFAANLRRPARIVFLTIALACSLLLFWLAGSRFVIGYIAAEAASPAPAAFLLAERFFPASSRLHARWAEVLLSQDLSKAEFHAQRAVDLSPYNYRYRMILGAVKESSGDMHGAEQSLREATMLAPNNSAARLQLAKLIAKQGRLSESVSEIRRATVADHTSQATSLDFVWTVSNGDVKAVEAAANEDAKSQLILANYLLSKSRASDAARVFGQIKDRDLIDSSEGATFLNNLLSSGHPKLTHDLWAKFVAGNGASLIWNGSFEEEPLKNFAHFDWKFDENRYARLAIEEGVAHSGRRSLRIEFAGHETTTLNNEIRQLLLLDGGAHYKLQCYVKTDRLVSSPPPKVVVSSVEASNWLGSSAPISEGTNDWLPLVIEFQTGPSGPEGGVPAIVSIKRTPAFVYDEPTRGTIWLDDFTLARLPR